MTFSTELAHIRNLDLELDVVSLQDEHLAVHSTRLHVMCERWIQCHIKF